MFEVLALLFASASIHFLVLAFHNRQKFSSRTFLKASLRILIFGVLLLTTLYLVRPFINNLYDELFFVLVVGFIIFFGFYLRDYREEDK